MGYACLAETFPGAVATGLPMAKGRSLSQFQKAFPDEACCAAFLVGRRWPDGFVCPGCAARRAAALHGHKHVPFHAQANVTVGGRRNTIMVIGCGSTTGAEDSPLCYDVVSFDPASTRWGVEFYRDASNAGAGFRIHEVAIDTRAANVEW